MAHHTPGALLRERHNERNRVKLVLVEWLDSHSGRGWQEIERIKEASVPLRCRSVGWLVSETGGVKVIVPHLAGEKNGVLVQGCGDLSIPKKAIVKLRELVEKERNR